MIDFGRIPNIVEQLAARGDAAGVRGFVGRVGAVHDDDHFAVGVHDGVKRCVQSLVGRSRVGERSLELSARVRGPVVQALCRTKARVRHSHPGAPHPRFHRLCENPRPLRVLHPSGRLI